MYKICKTVKSAERQKQFQDTLLSMMERMSLKEITITALCKEMNAPRKAFYRYFDSIEDVLHAKIDFALQKSILFLEIHPEVEKYFVFWEREKYLLDILKKHGMSNELMNRAHEIYKMQLTEKDMVQGFRQACWLSALITLLAIWHDTGMSYSPKEMGEILRSIFGSIV